MGDLVFCTQFKFFVSDYNTNGTPVPTVIHIMHEKSCFCFVNIYGNLKKKM